jgi:RES domain-containing protein
MVEFGSRSPGPAEEMRFQGIAYRAHKPRRSWSPLSGDGARRHGGRFNRIGVPALYLSLQPLTAIQEALGLGRFQPITLCAYEVDAEPIFDSVNQRARAAHAVTDRELDVPGWRDEMLVGVTPASQALADRLVNAGYVGMRVRSFAAEAQPGDLNLVLWRWSNRRPSRVVVIDDEGRLVPREREDALPGQEPGEPMGRIRRYGVTARGKSRRIGVDVGRLVS